MVKTPSGLGSLFSAVTSTIGKVGGLAVLLGLIFGGIQAGIAVCDKMPWCRNSTGSNEPAMAPAPAVPPQVVILGDGCRPLGVTGRLIVCHRSPVATVPVAKQAAVAISGPELVKRHPKTRVASYVRHAAPAPAVQPVKSPAACPDLKPFGVTDPRPCNSALLRGIEEKPGR